MTRFAIVAGLLGLLQFGIHVHAGNVFDLFIPAYRTLPFDVAVITAPTSSGEDVDSTPHRSERADYIVAMSAGCRLPCVEELTFLPAVDGQTVHKTAVYIGSEGTEDFGFRQLRIGEVGGVCEFAVRRDEAAAAAPTTLSITAHANGTIFLSTDSRFTNCQDRFDNTFFFVPVWTTLAPLFKLVPQFAQGSEYAVLVGAVSFIGLIVNLICCSSGGGQRGEHHRQTRSDHPSRSRSGDKNLPNDSHEVLVDDESAVKKAQAAERADQLEFTTSSDIEAAKSIAESIPIRHAESEDENATHRLGAEENSHSIAKEPDSRTVHKQDCPEISRGEVTVDEQPALAANDRGDDATGDNGSLSAESPSSSSANTPDSSRAASTTPPPSNTSTIEEAEPRQSRDREATPTVDSQDWPAAEDSSRTFADSSFTTAALTVAAVVAAVARFKQVGADAMIRDPKNWWDWSIYGALGVLAWKQIRSE